MGCGTSSVPPPQIDVKEPAKPKQTRAKSRPQSPSTRPGSPSLKRSRTIVEPFELQSDTERSEGTQLVMKLLREGVEADKKLMTDGDFKKKCMRASLAAQQGDTTLLQTMKKENIDRQTKLHRATLKKLWDYYDKNGDGTLSSGENRALMRDYFDGMYVTTAECMVDLITDGLKMTLSIMKQQGMPHEEVDAIFEEKIPQIQEHVPLIITKILRGFDTDENFDKILEAMDTDHNEKVDQDEFLSKFMVATNLLLDSDDLGAKVSQELQGIVG